MACRLSLILIGGSGSKVRQLHLSTRQFTIIAAFCILLSSVLGYGLVDYVRLQFNAAGKNILKHQLALQNDELRLQHRQIKHFARKIGELKDRVAEIDQLEKQIRQITNLEQPDSQETTFGIGGSPPEDLIPQTIWTENQHQLMKDLHRQMAQLNETTQTQQGALMHLLDRLKERENAMSHKPSIQPAPGWITSGFEYRRSPFTGKREFHKGVDIANRVGTPVVATADGTVTFYGKRGSFGNLMVVDHGNGVTTRYAHLGKGLMKIGEHVQRGEVIAEMGNTGRSTGPHVHYEVHVNGVPVNPSKYIMN